jgi:hypothetical protein
MSISVDSGYRTLPSAYSSHESPADPPAASPLGTQPETLEQGPGALSYFARGPLGPYRDPPPHSTIERMRLALDTDHALGELQTAQQDMIEASDSGNFRRIDEALTALTEAQDNFKQAVEAEGAASVLARHPNDPATKTAVSAAELAISQDKLAQVEAKIPNLKDIPPQEMADRIQPPELYQDLIDARTDVGNKSDALEHDLNAQVLGMRAQGMSREDALAQLRGQGYGHMLGSTNVELQNGKMPNTIGMNQNELMGVYLPNFERYASAEAIDAFNRGEPVIFAIRHDTPLQANGELGVYDDRYVVMQRSPGGVTHIKEFDGSQDPNTQYGDGMRDMHEVPAGQYPNEVGPYADARMEPFGQSSFGLIDAYSRVADGTIKFQTGPKADHLYPQNGDYMIEGDINGDGVFNDNYSRPAGNNGFQLHPGKPDYSHTGSGGCLTVPPHQWDEFEQAIGVFEPAKQDSIYYVQIGESKMQY